MLKNQIFIILTFVIFNSCDLKTAEEYYNMAYDLEEKGEFKKAIPFLDKAIEKKPQYRPALINRGADKSMIGDYHGAIADYQKVIAFDPNNTMVLMNIGNNYKRLKLYEKSVDYYTKALNTEGALKSDKVYIDINIDGPFDRESDYHVRKYEIEYERGISYVYLKKYDLAVKDLIQAVEFSHELPDALSWTGEAYYYLNDTINARKYLTEASKYKMLDAIELLEKMDKK